MKRPSGPSAPTSAVTANGTVDLRRLAQAICAEFYRRFPDELERSGEAGVEWCRHDNQYLLAWAIQEARDGTVSLLEQVRWLAALLDRRGFPLERLAGDLEVAADLTRGEGSLGELAEATARLLAASAEAVDAIASAAGHEAASRRHPSS
jgi:hypothetical protein